MSQMIYNSIPGDEVTIKVCGTKRPAKPYDIREGWFNASKRGNGFFLSFKPDGAKRALFIAIDNKTANGKYWQEYCNIPGGNKKVTCKGYFYVNDKGYCTYVVKNVSNFKQLAASKIKDGADVPGVHFKNERTYTVADFESMISDLNELDF